MTFFFCFLALLFTGEAEQFEGLIREEDDSHRESLISESNKILIDGEDDKGSR